MAIQIFGFRVVTTLIYGQVTFETSIEIKPCIKRNYLGKAQVVYNWFEGSWTWVKLLSGLERVFVKKNWSSSLISNFDGMFYLDKNIQVEYKVKSRGYTGDQRDYNLVCSVEYIKERNQFYNERTSTNSNVIQNPENRFVRFSLEGRENAVTPSNDELYCPVPILSVSDPLPIPQYKANPIGSTPNGKRRRGRPRVNKSKGTENKTDDAIATNAGNNRSKKRKKDATDVSDVSHLTKKPTNLKRARSKTRDPVTTDTKKNGYSLRLKQPKEKGNVDVSQKTKKAKPTNLRRKRSKSCDPVATETINNGPLLGVWHPKEKGIATTITTSTRTSSTTTIRKSRIPVKIETTMPSSSSRRHLRTASYTENIEKPIKKIKVVDLCGTDDDEDATNQATTSSSAGNSVKPTQPPPNSEPKCEPNMLTSTTTSGMESVFNIVERYMKLIKPSTPKKVDVLTLREMNSNDVLNTFERYKGPITVVYNELQNKIDTCTSYKGLSHLLVIDLFEPNIEEDMMNILTYNFDLPPTNQYLNIAFNALIPSWTLLIYMERYKMTREDAIKHLNEQQAYTDYLDAKTNPKLVLLSNPNP